MHDYSALGENLIAIVGMLEVTLTPGERDEVLEFVDANELGIALETLCSILTERDAEVPSNVASLIADAGAQMHMDPGTWASLVQR